MSSGAMSSRVNFIGFAAMCIACLLTIRLCIGIAMRLFLISRTPPFFNLMQKHGMLSSNSTSWQLGSNSLANCSCVTSIRLNDGSTALLFSPIATSEPSPTLYVVDASIPLVHTGLTSRLSGLPIISLICAIYCSSISYSSVFSLSFRLYILIASSLPIGRLATS